jgi:hypothetical protein
MNLRREIREGLRASACRGRGRRPCRECHRAGAYDRRNRPQRVR